MEYANPRFLNFGLLGSLLALSAACSAEDPQPINQGPSNAAAGPTSGGTVQPGPGISPTPVTPGTPTIANAPVPTPVTPQAQPTANMPVPAQPVMPTAAVPTSVTPTAAPVETAPTAAEPAAPAPAAAGGGEGNALVPVGSDLWVGADTNGVGVVGSWYGYQDASTTGCCEDLLTLEEGTVCMAGETAAAEPGNYDIWGAGMGFNFNDSKPWDGSAYSGVSFTATIDSAADVKIIMKMATTAVEAGGEHFVVIAAGANTISWTTVAQPDWAAAVAFDPSDIEAMQVQVGPGDGAANPFTVCISDMTVLD